MSRQTARWLWICWIIAVGINASDAAAQRGPTRPAIMGIAASPDGKHIALAIVQAQAGHGRIAIYSVAEKRLRLLPAFGDWNLRQPSYSRDGRSLVVAAHCWNTCLPHNESKLLTLNMLVPRSPWRVVVEGLDSRTAPSFTPDGSHILFSFGKLYDPAPTEGDVALHRLSLLSISSGQVVWTAPDSGEFAYIYSPTTATDKVIGFYGPRPTDKTLYSEARRAGVGGSASRSIAYELPVPFSPENLNGNTSPRISNLSLRNDLEEINYLSVTPDGRQALYLATVKEPAGSRPPGKRNQSSIEHWDGSRVTKILEGTFRAGGTSIHPNGNSAAALLSLNETDEWDVFLVDLRSKQLQQLHIKSLLPRLLAEKSGELAVGPVP